jgi:hypothetical protein
MIQAGYILVPSHTLISELDASLIVGTVDWGTDYIHDPEWVPPALNLSEVDETMTLGPDAVMEQMRSGVF